MSVNAMPGFGFSQRTGRVHRFYTDQHGRQFSAWADAATNSPLGEFTPHGFACPWQPPMRFAKFAQVGDLTFTWQYDEMADELGQMTAAYYSDATKIAISEKLDVPDVGGAVDKRIRDVLGPPPMSPLIPLSAKAGDRWLLGDPDAVPDAEIAAVFEQQAGGNAREALRLITARVTEKYHPSPRVVDGPTTRTVADVAVSTEAPPLSYKAFIEWARADGLSFADAQAAWRLYKDDGASLADVKGVA